MTSTYRNLQFSLQQNFMNSVPKMNEKAMKLASMEVSIFQHNKASLLSYLIERVKPH